jgi:hypothetical protein
MCNLNEALGHKDYCATGCPKCNPMGENMYGYLVDNYNENGEQINDELICVNCGFIIHDSKVTHFSNRQFEKVI